MTRADSAARPQRSVAYEELFPWQIAAAMAAAPIAYLPLGVLEWHGEHGAVGLDGLKAHAICTTAARRSGGLVVPTLWWGADEREDLTGGDYLTGGIELGERYHVPGTMFWIRPETFAALLADMFEAMRRRGFRAIVVLAGHWSPRVYLPTVRAAGDAFIARETGVGWLMVTDQELGADHGYRPEHAAGGETSVLLAIQPDLVDLAMSHETDGALAAHYAAAPEHLAHCRASDARYIGLFTGTDDGSNDPETATAARGEQLLDLISRRLADRATALLTSSGWTPSAAER